MIILFTPALMDNNNTPSTNLGDLIIHEAIVRELRSIFPKEKISNISSHCPIPYKAFDIRQNDKIIVGGSNLLSSNMNQYAQWKINLSDILKLKNVILLGVGWWQYQEQPNYYTKILLKNILSKHILHSVRDSYTESMLSSIGINNVINTNCPTMWPMAIKDFSQIPLGKSENVLVMITDYKKNRTLDQSILKIISKYYNNIFFWPQGVGDLDYFQSLIENSLVTILERSLSALDSLLQSEIPFDYIGTRLHGGIRCLLNDRRSLILRVDNRAKEISKDTGLPCVARDDLSAIENWINSEHHTKLKINKRNIDAWKSQFI
jgi:polysaccharide pyruvyl transferase WcaK-like protein